MEKRVVITGLGTINPIGNNVNDTWTSIENSKCGIDKITYFDTENYRTKMAAEVKEYDPLNYFDPKEVKRLDKVSQYAMIAAREAFKDSGISQDNTDYNNVGIYIGSGIGGFETIQKQCEINAQKGNRFVSPFLIPMAIVNIPTGNVAIDLGLKGESMCVVSACASSTHCIGEAYRAIKHGYQDVILAGGAEAAICQTGIAGFENMHALSSSEDKNRASIPFDKERDGFVMGEGAGILVLESLDHAIKRKAKIYAEVVGYGSTTDSYHITSPDPTGAGAKKCMENAIKDAGLDIKDIDYINAHGTSTVMNDMTETKAIEDLFKDYVKNLMVSSTKGNTGHLLGAAGAIEAIISVLAINNRMVPPTINYKEKDDNCNLNIVPNKAVHKNIEVAMSNSLGFGGHNATIVIKKYS